MAVGIENPIERLRGDFRVARDAFVPSFDRPKSRVRAIERRMTGLRNDVALAVGSPVAAGPRSAGVGRLPDRPRESVDHLKLRVEVLESRE